MTWKHGRPEAIGGKGRNGDLAFRILCRQCNSYLYTECKVDIGGQLAIKCSRCGNAAESFDEPRKPTFGPAGSMNFDTYDEWNKEAKRRDLMFVNATGSLLAQDNRGLCIGAWFYGTKRGWMSQPK